MYQDSEDPQLYQRKLQELRKMLDDGVIDVDEYHQLKDDLRHQTRARLNLSSDYVAPEDDNKPEFVSASELEIRKMFALMEIKLCDGPDDLISIDDK